jgi:hypothetical protein
MRFDRSGIHNERLPSFPKHSKHVLLFMRLLRPVFRRHLHRSRREHAWPTPVLQIRQSLVCTFRLDNDGSIPARVNEESVRTRNRYPLVRLTGAIGVLVAVLKGLPWRSRTRFDYEGRSVHPTNDVVLRALRATIRNSRLSIDEEKQTGNDRVGYSVTLTFQYGPDLAATANWMQSLLPKD